MDLKDFRNLVNTSAFKGELNGLKIIVDYPHLNSEIEFKGVQSIYKFVNDQVIGWNKLKNIPSEFLVSKIHFEKLKSNLIAILSHTDANYRTSFNNEFNYFQNEFIKSKLNRNDFIFTYDAPETDFLISIHKKSGEIFLGALNFITNSTISQNKDSQYFTGLLLAYEFKHQGVTEILNRRSNEKASLSQIRSKYNEYIIEAEQQLNSNIIDAKENLTNHFESVSKLKEEKNKHFDEWFTGVQNGFDNFFETATKSISTNEDLYKEKLRLEAPAKFWKDRAILLKNEGRSYLNWLMGISIISAILLFTLLMLLGSDYFDQAFNDKIKGIKWSIILITIVSLLAFTIKILSKMTFSSFHLSRDAEEREQLTHFYLALKKDTTIEPEERQLILQSLFSRADTGLLKEDSSPTMPTSIIDKFSGK